MKARFLTVFALWSLVVIVAMIVVLLSAPGFAQDGKEPFQLQVERRHLQEDRAANDPSDGASLRISRGRLGLDALSPALAPTIAAQRASLDSSQFNLHARDFALPGDAALFAGTPRAGIIAPTRSPTLKGAVSVKELANFDIELIVDQSLSMRQRDCPDFLSRWQWCGAQLGELSTQLAPFTPHGFTLTTFSGDFQTYPHATALQLQQLFANPQFSRGTRLSLPLQSRLQSYFERRSSSSRPLLIVVVTDGVPQPRDEPQLVADSLIAATQELHSPKEVTVVFFQIGGADRFGRMFLHAMDTELIANGARYDIVQNVPFEQLQSQGLTSALVGAVRSFANQSASK